MRPPTRRPIGHARDPYHRLDMRRTSFRRPGLNVMVTSWGDNQIETYKLTNKGASVTVAAGWVVPSIHSVP